MIYLSFRFDEPFALLTLLFIFVISGLWAYGRFKKNLNVNFAPIVIFNFLSLGVWALVFGIPHDEAEHLHLAWLVSQGMIPYKDFWQHHPPFLWIITAPFIKSFSPSVDIINIARILCGAVLALNIFLGWRIARAIWGKEARFIVYILMISSILLSGQFLFFRPDVFMLLFLLLGIRISLEIPEKNVLPSFFAGLAFALAASFMVKQYFVFLLPIAAVLIGEKRSRPIKLLCYFLGLAWGFLPLAAYLINNGIVKDYLFWVFVSNGQRMTFSVYFQVAIVAFGFWGGVILFNRSRNSGEPKFLILLLALCLSTLSSLTTTLSLTRTTIERGGYYLAFWFFICAITASGCDLPGLFKRIPSLKKRAVVFGICTSLFVASTISNLIFCKKYKSVYSADNTTVAQLIHYCAGDNCLAILPTHPIFSRDTTRLYSFWQYSNIDENPIVKNDLKRHPMAGQIITNRPALVLCRDSGKDFFLDLFQKDLISALEYKQLVSFFKENYTQKKIGKKDYYIRNDKL